MTFTDPYAALKRTLQDALRQAQALGEHFDEGLIFHIEDALDTYLEDVDAPPLTPVEACREHLRAAAAGIKAHATPATMDQLTQVLDHVEAAEILLRNVEET